MFGLWKSKKRKAEEERNDLKAIVTEDLLGASEWKESKVGYLTGLSSVGRIAANFGTTLSQSFGRTSLTIKILTQREKLPSLPEVEVGNADGGSRFRAAMKLHNVKEANLSRALSNTWKSFYFYGATLIVAAVWLGVRLHAGTMTGTALTLHLAPIPLLVAYTFKAAFINWTFRRTSLNSPAAFLKSGEWLPKK